MTVKQAYLRGFEEKQAQLLRDLASAFGAKHPAVSWAATLVGEAGQGLRKSIATKVLGKPIPPTALEQVKQQVFTIGMKLFDPKSRLGSDKLEALGKERQRLKALRLHLLVQDASKETGLPYNLVNRAHAGQKSLGKSLQESKYDLYPGGEYNDPIEIARGITANRPSNRNLPSLIKLKRYLVG